MFAGKNEPRMDRDTGYIDADNSGKGNIFAIEPKTLYTSSPTADAASKKGIGGILGVVIAAGILAAVGLSTKTLESFEATSSEFINFQGQSVSYYADKFSS